MCHFFAVISPTFSTVGLVKSSIYNQSLAAELTPKNKCHDINFKIQQSNYGSIFSVLFKGAGGAVELVWPKSTV
jgi:hypothetical protein